MASFKGVDFIEFDSLPSDEEVDNLVYALYGITNEERRIIEGSL